MLGATIKSFSNCDYIDLMYMKQNSHCFMDLFLILVPRSRNSIAVSSVEHLKNGNKRPHSIISVSSSSSSNSSHSSGFGAMTIPGLEPMPEDSVLPGARTSLTLCSNGEEKSLKLDTKIQYVFYSVPSLRKGNVFTHHKKEQLC